MAVSEINREIAELLNIEHITLEEGAYEQFTNEDPYYGLGMWITFTDFGEYIGEQFPKDWERDLNAAVLLFEHTKTPFCELRYDAGTGANFRWVAKINAHHPSNEVSGVASTPAKAVCLAWLTWQEFNAVHKSS